MNREPQAGLVPLRSEPLDLEYTMLSIKSLQSRLDHISQNARSEVQDAQVEASESGDVEDIRAFTDASRKAQIASAMTNESLRAKHGITKSILDGIQ
jgi:hypothetical protein